MTRPVKLLLVLNILLLLGIAALAVNQWRLDAKYDERYESVKANFRYTYQIFDHQFAPEKHSLPTGLEKALAEQQARP